MNHNSKLIKILITGANGQLGMCLKDQVKKFPSFEYHFKSSKELDITNREFVSLLFSEEKYDYCINCAAYTAVDKAEEERERAFLVNAEAVKYLAEASKKSNTTLIHISTDFVFDGTKTSPYTEEDSTNPINVYGASKLKGEQYVQEILSNYFIIRTSWVYSEYGNNFVKTMLRLAKERDEISVVNDQVGSPTYAGDLAEFLLTIIAKNSNKYGLYNYSNEGVISWYNFATEIFKDPKVIVELNSIKATEYITPATRPGYSVLSKLKIKKEMNIEIPFWIDSLKKCLTNSNHYQK